MYVFVNVHECRCVCNGRDQSGRVLWVLKLDGFSNVIIKDLAEKDSQVHRDKGPCPRERLPNSCPSLIAQGDTQPARCSHLSP